MPSLKTPYVKLRLGHRRKRGSLPAANQLGSLPKTGSAGDGSALSTEKRPEVSFEFKVTYHEHLFWTLQARMFFSAAHIGRVEIRLDRLRLGETRHGWHELLPRTACAQLVEMGIAAKPDRVLGAIELRVEYTSITATTSLLTSSSEIDLVQQVEEERTIRRKSIAQTLGPPSAADAPPAAVESEVPDDRTSIESDKLDQLDESMVPSGDWIDKLTGMVLNQDDVMAVRSIRAILAGFGQGIEVSNYRLTLAFVLLQKFFAAQPRLFTNNLELRRGDIELPRHVYRYTMATMGWRGLNFFGRGGGILYDLARPDADKKTVLEYLGIPEPDLLVFNLDEHMLYRPNFFVCIDRQLSALILSIRGTMSMRDTLTDLVCEYVPWNGGLVHSGIMTSASWFFDNICRQMLLWAAEYNVKHLYIVGHSLGGGTSALCTVLLLEHLRANPDEWPMQAQGDEKPVPVNIHCYSYGTPPIVSANLADRYDAHIDCFLNGDDVVPRLCYGTCADLRLMIIHAASLAQTWHLFSDGSAVFAELARLRSALQASPTHPKLCQPGRLHHFLGLPAPAAQHYRLLETVSWTRFWEMELRQRMLVHHLPSRYEEALEQAWEHAAE